MVEKKKSSTQTCCKIFGDRDFGSIKRILWPIIVSITQKKMFDEFREQELNSRIQISEFSPVENFVFSWTQTCSKIFGDTDIDSIERIF